jgi:hypothetical protein
MKMFVLLISLTISLNSLAQGNISYLEQLEKSKLQLKRMNSEQYYFNELPSILDSLSHLETFLMEVDSSTLNYPKELKKDIVYIYSIEKQQMSLSTAALVSSVNSYLGQNIIIEGIVQSLGKASNDKLFILLSNNVKCIFSKSQQLEVLKTKYGSEISIKGEISKANGEIVLNNATFVIIKKTSGEKARILDNFRKYIGNLIIVVDDKMINTIKDEYRKAIELFNNKKYSVALNNFEDVSKFGNEFHELKKISDSTNNYIPYLKAFILEEQGNYHNASIIFDSIYTFRESKVHLENCLTKYYDNQSQYVTSQKNENMLINLFQDLHNNILKGKDKYFFDSLYKRVKYSFRPVLQSWIIGNPIEFIQIPSFNAKMGRDDIVVPKFYLCPHEFNYTDLVCCCIIINEDSILSEWSAVQSFKGGMFDGKGSYTYYHIKNNGDLTFSIGHLPNIINKIEEFLGLKFLNDLLLICLDQQYPKNKYNEKYLRTHMGNKGGIIWD